jgi:hypothetical protein
MDMLKPADSDRIFCHELSIDDNQLIVAHFIAGTTAIPHLADRNKIWIYDFLTESDMLAISTKKLCKLGNASNAGSTIACQNCCAAASLLAEGGFPLQAEGKLLLSDADSAW